VKEGKKCDFSDNLAQLIEELDFLHKITEHLDVHIQTFKTCSKNGGCCKEMKQIQRHSKEAHEQVHDLLEHIEKLKEMLRKCSFKGNEGCDLEEGD